MPLKPGDEWLSNQPTTPAPPLPGVTPQQARQAVAVTPPGEPVSFEEALVEMRALAARNAEEDRRRKAAVKTEAWRAEKPQNSAISHDDGEHQSWLENTVGVLERLAPSAQVGKVIGNALLRPGEAAKNIGEGVADVGNFPRYAMQGVDDVNRSELVYKKYVLKKPLSDDEERQLAELTAKRNSRDPAQAAPKSIMGQVVRALPSSGHVFVQSLPAAAQGGMIGFVGGSAFPVVGNAAGAIGGFGLGSTVGSVGPSFKLNSAEAYEEFSAMRDENGNPIPPDVVRAASIAYGLVATGLDTFAFSKELKLAGIKPGKLTGSGIKELLMQKPVRDGLQELVERLGPAAFYEGTTEGMQAIAQYMVGKLAQAVTTSETGTDFKGDNLVEVGKGVLNEATVGAITGSVVVAPGASVMAYEQQQLANQATAREKYLKALAEGPDSKLKAELPDKYREYAEHLTKGGPVENVYITASAFREFFQEQGLDPDEAARELGLPEGEIARALAEGGEIKVPMADYLTKVVKTPLGEAMMRHTKFAPGTQQMTSAERDDFRANEPEIVAQMEAEAKAKAEMSDAERADRRALRDQFAAEFSKDPDFTPSQIDDIADHYVDKFYGFARANNISAADAVKMFPFRVVAERAGGRRPSTEQKAPAFDMAKIDDNLLGDVTQALLDGNAHGETETRIAVTEAEAAALRAAGIPVSANSTIPNAAVYALLDERGYRTGTPRPKPKAAPKPPAGPVDMTSYEAVTRDRESKGDLNAKAKTSSALGPHQFINSTWISIVGRHGLPGDPNAKAVAQSFRRTRKGELIIETEAQRKLLLMRTDDAASTFAFHALTQENQVALRKALNREPTAGELYIAHFAGSGGAIKLLTADPTASAAEIMPGSAKANPTIFYTGRGKNGRARTVAEVVAELTKDHGGATYTPGAATVGGVDGAANIPIPDGPEAPEIGPGGETFDQFAGRRALTADMGKLRVAQLMEKRDASPEQIWKETGWNRGKDNQWRFEIDDSQARLKPDGVAKLKATVTEIPQVASNNWTQVDPAVDFAQTGTVTLGELIDHDALFAAYPRLRDVPVYLGGPPGSRGSFSPGTGEMTIGPEYANLPEVIVRTTLHEIQHMIQTLEGFANGAPASATGLRMAGYGDVLDQTIEEIVNTYPPAERDAARRRVGLMADAVYETYRRSEGEVEARNTQTRQFMSEAERSVTPPDYTRDVPRSRSAIAPRPEGEDFRDRYGTPYADAAPNFATRAMADAYVAKHKPTTRTAPLVPVEIDEELMKRIADEYDDQVSKPNDPEVRRHYEIAAREIMQMAEAMGDLEIELMYGEGEPYANSDAMRDDVLLRRRMRVYATTPETFGSGNPDDLAHPFLAETDFTDVNGKPLLVNDLFRAVHDYFGHATSTAGFGPKGELNAFLEHAAMFSDEALRVIAPETLMQNAQVNFGRHMRRADGSLPQKGDSDYIGLADRPFADQKAFLVPQWVLREVFQRQEQTDRAARLAEREEALLRSYNGAREGQGLAPDATRIVPLAGPDGRVTLTHWGRRKNLKALDPRRWGDNATILTREERNAVENDDVPRRTYYGVDVGQPWGYEREDGLGPHRYTARVDVDRLYDFDADPDGLKAKVVELVESGEWGTGERGSAYERVIADAGYAGYWSRHANLKMVAVVFERLAADYQAPSTTTFYQEDVFYSGLGRAIEGLQIKEASPEQWIDLLSRTPGVKKEELEWTGTLDYLSQRATILPGANRVEPVTREELLAYVNDNGLVLETKEFESGDLEGAGKEGDLEALMETEEFYLVEQEYADQAFNDEYDSPDWTVSKVSGLWDYARPMSDEDRFGFNMDKGGAYFDGPVQPPAEPEPRDDLTVDMFADGPEGVAPPPPLPPLDGWVIEHDYDDQVLMSGEEWAETPERDSPEARRILTFTSREAAENALVDLMDQHRDAAREEWEDRGGSDYARERAYEWAQEQVGGSEPDEGDTRHLRYIVPGPVKKYTEILMTLPSINLEGGKTHWGGMAKNVIAHARTTVRELVDGREVAHLDEAQSDILQAGRREGFKGVSTPEQIAAAAEAYDAAIASRDWAVAEQSKVIRPLAIRILAAQSAVLAPLQLKRRQTVMAALGEAEHLTGVLGEGRTVGLIQARDMAGAAVDDAYADRVDDRVDIALRTIARALGERGNDEAAQRGWAALTAMQTARVELMEAERADVPIYRGSQLQLTRDLEDRSGTFVRDGLITAEEMNAILDANAVVKAAKEAATAAYKVNQRTVGTQPNAPFKGDAWATLVARRFIRWAVDNGHERVTWSTGWQIGPAVGGPSEAMETFYSGTLRKAFEKIIKGLSKIETYEIEGIADPGPGHDGVNFGFEITPALAEVAEGGFTLFQREGGYKESQGNDERKVSAKAQKLAEKIPGLKRTLRYLKPDEKAKLRKDTATKLMAYIKGFPSAEEMASVAFSGRAKRGWYRDSANALLEVFGVEDAPRFAALLAALSPQTSVEDNLINTLRVWTAWDKAGRPTDERQIRRLMGQNVQGSGTEKSVLKSWINNSVTALTTENPADIQLSGPKVNSFMLNLVGVVDEVTNDAWMANYALVDQAMFAKAGESPGKGPGYVAMSALVRKAADVISKRLGEAWTPAEVQETVWSWARTLYVKRNKVAKAAKAAKTGVDTTTRDILAAGGLTHEDIGDTPDFALLFLNGIYSSILREGGYGEQLENLGSRGRAVRTDGSVGDASRPEGSGIDDATFRRHLESAAKRLEQLRTQRLQEAARERVEKARKRAEAAARKADPSILAQREDDGTPIRRGSIQMDRANFGKGVPSTISLFLDRNMTTPFHEGAHHFLEAMIAVVRNGTATPQITEMVNDLLLWFNVPTIEDIGRREHEMYAEAYEQYLYEGRAPALRLAPQFSRIRTWMVAAYQRQGGRRADVTDEVRRVFDRLLASHTEIAEAIAMQGLEPLFADPLAAGMDAALAEAYQTVARRARADAEDEAAREVMAAVNREQKAWYREERERVREEVAAELAEDPGYQALDWITRGKWIGAEQPAELEPFKLSRPIIVSEYGADQLKAFPPSFGKVYAAEGVHPDFAAELFGFDSGQALFDDWKGKPRRSDAIEQETGRRMLERYGDPMVDGTMPDVATDAVHNVSQQRLIELELEHLQGRPAFKGLRAAAERQAEDRTIKDLAGYDRHLANERRAANEAQRAFRAKDLTAAAQAKFRQLVAFHAWSVSRAAAKEVEKGRALFDRVIGGKPDAVARSRNMDYVMAARAILAAYGVGKASQNPMAYMAMIREYDPETADLLDPEVLAAMPVQPRELDSLTLNEFRSLAATVKSLYALARKEKTIEIEGRVVLLDAAAGEIGEQINEVSKAPGGITPSESTTDMQKLLRGAAGIRNSIRRVESWARRMDNGTVGPFTRYLWRPISAAADAYRDLSGDLRMQYAGLLETIKPGMTWKKIAAPEINHIFRDKSELLHAILHTGNESNKRKLLLGGGGKGPWVQVDENGEMISTPWDNMIARLAADGTLTKTDFDFAQAVWDLLESAKPGAQRAHRKLIGRYFDEVTANEVKTPFGTYRGGYVPAIGDTTKIVDANLRAEMESITEGGGTSMFPTTPRGFTKGRVENYTKPLALDLRLLAQHLDKVALFTHLAVPVKDATRLLMHRDVKEALAEHDPAAMTDMLIPWLERAARQSVSTPSRGVGGKLFDRFFASIRARTGQQVMLGNLTNALQQLTGFTVALTLVKPTFVAKGMWQMMTSPAETAAAIAAASPMMKDRMSSQTMEAAYGIEAVLLRPNPYTATKQFVGRHAYFLQHAMQNIVDTSVWVGAHSQALERGDTEIEAARHADAVIRQTQGSLNPEDISRYESGPAFVRQFTQFASYFNMQSNLLVTEGGQAARDGNYARLAWVYMMGFAAPALLAEAIKLAMRGEIDDEDEDGWIDDFLDWFVGSQFRGATAMVPVIGPTINASANAFNDKFYDDKLSLSPSMGAAEAAARTPKNIAQLAAGEGDWSRTAKDSLTLMGLAIGIPVGALNRPLGYAIDVMEGDVVPTDPLDAVRGAVTGAPSEASRQ